MKVVSGETAGFKLPSGREPSIYDLVKFCYDLSETDLEVLFKIVRKGEASIEELSDELGVSNATISRSLGKLIGMGFAKRRRSRTESGIGRPRYVYTADKEEIEKKLKTDIEFCSDVIKKVVTESFKGSIISG